MQLRQLKAGKESKHDRQQLNVKSLVFGEGETITVKKSLQEVRKGRKPERTVTEGLRDGQ